MKVPDEEFVAGVTYKLAYRLFANTDGIEATLECPQCGGVTWIYQTRTGTKKLSKDHAKLKCASCGLFFIAAKRNITKQLI